MIEASTTLSPCTPWTLPDAYTTAPSAGEGPSSLPLRNSPVRRPRPGCLPSGEPIERPLLGPDQRGSGVEVVLVLRE